VIRSLGRKAVVRVCEISVRAALRDQGLDSLRQRLETIVSDISQQYSGFTLNTDLLFAKVRAQHAFQVSLIQEAFERFKLVDVPGTVVLDIGDSSGTHLAYLRAMYPSTRAIGVNLDPVAVEKIRQRGFEAVHCRAEDVHRHVDRADVLLSFEMLEHLVDPIGFLRTLSASVDSRCFVITVPYVRHSRVQLDYIRRAEPPSTPVTEESTHVFELSPDDWMLLFRFTGWAVVSSRTFYQYPRRLRHVLAPLWRRYDFEGFFGAILVRDHEWSGRYPW
jgi:2-polyprenyl-3-methyl-5-hydroxy-6-metoxy-1,4-benzoquinol methylase